MLQLYWVVIISARGAQYIRHSSDLSVNRLDGMIPVAEDWHAKVMLMVTTRLVVGEMAIESTGMTGCTPLCCPDRSARAPE